MTSENSVDVFNPKVVSAAKGSLLRVRVMYDDLGTLFTDHADLPVMGAYMDGENIYKSALHDHGILLIGNEANGISDALSVFITKKISGAQNIKSRVIRH